MEVSKRAIRTMAIDARLTGQTLYIRRCDCTTCRLRNKHYFAVGADAALDDALCVETQSDYPLMSEWEEVDIEAVLRLTEEDANDRQ